MADTDIRPFKVDIPEQALDNLRERVELRRLPSKELVADRSQGVQLATIQELARYWAAEYNWRACEAKLNALPQFVTKICTSSPAPRHLGGRSPPGPA